jgi:hypothetical protein
LTSAAVTVGIPTYNRAEWLRESIACVLAQTFRDFRLIVSDNASEDDTPDVVRSFNDARIDYVRSEQNLGAIGNLNRLVELADTEYLVLLPDDDLLYPGHLAAAVELMERNQRVGLAHTAFDFIDEQSRPVQRVHPIASRSPITTSGARAIEWMMSSRWGLCFPSVMYRTKAIADLGGFRDAEEPFGDRKLWLRVALKWDYGYLPTALAGFRTHAAARQQQVGGPHEESTDEQRVRLFSQIHYQHRLDFIEESALGSDRSERLRAITTLTLLVENAAYGLPFGEVAGRLARILQAYPRIVGRAAFWRLLGAQFGGRWARAALERAAGRRLGR